MRYVSEIIMVIGICVLVGMCQYNVHQREMAEIAAKTRPYVEPSK